MTLRRAVPMIILVAIFGVVAVGCASSDTSSSRPAPTTTRAGTSATRRGAATTSTPAGPPGLEDGFAPGRHVVPFDVDGVARTAVLVLPDGVARPAPLGL